MIDNLDEICKCFISYIDRNTPDNYNDQLNSLINIITYLENLISLEYFKNEKFRVKIQELLDFRNIPNFNKKNIRDLC